MVLVEADGVAVLIDAGISTREALRRMERVGLSPEPIQAVLLTHEHSDHCKGVDVLARRLKVPVYMSEGTAEGYIETYHRVNHRALDIRPFKTGKAFRVGPFLIEPFPTPHDSRDSCGYILWYRDIKMGVVTDLGHMPMLVRRRMHGARLLVLESNHDEKMLLQGPYPLWLKQRIMSRHGHLSNRMVAEYIREQLDGWCEYLFLAHISKENNTPERALASTMEALDARRNRDTRVVLTSQEAPTPVIQLE